MSTSEHGDNGRMAPAERSAVPGAGAADGSPLRDASREAIEQRAYARFQARGAVHGYDLDDWVAAENDLRPGAQASDRDEQRIGGAETETLTPVPLAGGEEASRIRASNDRDQELEREGEASPHNRGYDAVVRGSDRATSPSQERRRTAR